MNDNKPAAAATPRATRAERLAAELRENLKRRKAQARARGAPSDKATNPADGTESGLPSGGEDKTGQ